MSSCSRAHFSDFFSFLKTFSISWCLKFSTWSVVSVSSCKKEKRLEGQDTIIFIMFPVPQK